MIKLILGGFVLLVVAVVGIMGYNWVVGNNKVAIEAPANGTTIFSENMRVLLNTTDRTKADLEQSGNNYQIVTYLDGKEVQRGKELSFELHNLAVGQHQLKVAIADTRANSVSSLSLQPGPVDFAIASSAAKGTGSSAIYLKSALNDTSNEQINAANRLGGGNGNSSTPAPVQISLDSAFRSLLIFYVIGFLGALTFLGYTLQRRHRHLE